MFLWPYRDILFIIIVAGWLESVTLFYFQSPISVGNCNTSVRLVQVRSSHILHILLHFLILSLNGLMLPLGILWETDVTNLGRDYKKSQFVTYKSRHDTPLGSEIPRQRIYFLYPFLLKKNRRFAYLTSIHPLYTLKTTGNSYEGYSKLLKKKFGNVISVDCTSTVQAMHIS